MAADIVPELAERIQKDFDRQVKQNKKIRNFLRRLDKGTVTAKEVYLYTEQVSACAANALCRYLKAEYLPGGKLYWNIAERIMRPFLQKVWQMVMDAAKTQQMAADKTKSIHLNPVIPPFPSDRIHDLINKLMEYWEEGADGE